MENCSCLPVMRLLQGLGGFHLAIVSACETYGQTAQQHDELPFWVPCEECPVGGSLSPSKSTPRPFSTNARHHQAGSSFPPPAVVLASADFAVKKSWTARQRVSYLTSATKRNLVWTDREAACVKVVGAGTLGAVRQPRFSIRNTKITLFHCKAKAK